MNRAIIVSSSADTAAFIGELLEAEGYGMIAVASSGSEARRLVVSDTEPELVVINTPLPDEFGQELAVMIAELNRIAPSRRRIRQHDIMLICHTNTRDLEGRCFAFRLHTVELVERLVVVHERRIDTGTSVTFNITL